MFLKTKAKRTGTAKVKEILIAPVLLEVKVLMNINIGMIKTGRKKVVALFRLRVLTTNLV
jgi:hypothetical protein